MTEVAFHVNRPDKLAYACRLLRKAYGTGARVVVTGEPELLRELDHLLWTFSPLDFVPHCYGPAVPPQVQSRTPVVLLDSPRAAPHRQVLVNISPALPDGFEQFERLLEVVGDSEPEMQQARERWRHYKDRGYAVVKHEPEGR